MGSLWDRFLGSDEDDKTKGALIDSNHKLTAIIYTIFQGYQTNVNAIVEENKRISAELEQIKCFLKEKTTYGK